MGKNSYWLKSGFYSMGYRLSVLIFGFGSFYFLIRYFSQAEFGAWALFISITTIIEMSRNGLIQNAVIKLIHTSDPNDEGKIVLASFSINIIYSAIIYLLLAGFSGVLSRMFHIQDIGTMFVYYGVTIFFLIPFSQFNYIQQAKFSFSGIFWSTVLRQGSFFLAVLFICVMRVKITLIDLVLIQAACTFAGLICAYFCARKFIRITYSWDGAIVKKVLGFGKYVMGTNICSLLFKTVDQFSVGYFLNANIVALYNSAIRVSNLIEYPSTSVAEVVYPQSAFRTSSEGDHAAKVLYEKSVGLTLALTLPVVIGTVLLADYIIFIIAGPEYHEAATILRITILYGIFTPFNRQFGTVMDSSGRPQLNFALMLASVFINIISNYLFIQQFGMIGAAYGTLLSYVIVFLVGNTMLTRIFGIEMQQIFHYMFYYYGVAFQFIQKKLKTRLQG
ncbi:MAG TPA: flippase [Ohtaekwangia sp.]|uniref:flippase n=1 Tax=Ohtaekwangia sp. TaxID=2066019 RepID=UPI002F91F084